MTSSRLPGKVLLPAAGKPMLLHLVSRLQKVPSIAEIVLATTANSSDDVLADFAGIAGISCFRGSEEDVMSRVIGAAESVEADVVVEITGDCPVIDPEIIEQTIQMYIHNPCDYASNVVVRCYPMGMDTQVFGLDVLKKSFSMTDEPLDREHVTRHIRQNPEMFNLLHLIAPQSLWWPELALTLDEERDYELLKRVIESFEDRIDSFSCGDIISLLRSQYPDWVELNEGVRRKGLDA